MVWYAEALQPLTPAGLTTAGLVGASAGLVRPRGSATATRQGTGETDTLPQTVSIHSGESDGRVRAASPLALSPQEDSEGSARHRALPTSFGAGGAEPPVLITVGGRLPFLHSSVSL